MEKNIITAGLYKDTAIDCDDDNAFIIIENDSKKMKLYLNSCTIKKIRVANNPQGDTLYICNIDWNDDKKSVINITESIFEKINAGVHCGGPEPEEYIETAKETDKDFSQKLVEGIILFLIAVVFLNLLLNNV